MLRKYLFLLICPVLTFGQISVDNIWKFKYYPKSIEGFQSMNDGKNYTILTNVGIEKISYADKNNKSIIISGEFSNYQFNADETLILLETSSTPIYRHSVLGQYKVYNTITKKTIPLANGQSIVNPIFSPDNKHIAYVLDNNIYVQNIDNQNITQVTTDGAKNKIINGVNDWVYEEEFGHVSAMEWNADGTHLIYVKFDESQVKEIYIPIYQNNLYPEEMRFKYPKAGEDNSKVSLYNYMLSSKKNEPINLSGFENYYIPLLKSSNKPDEVLVLTSNRHQNKVDILSLNPIDNSVGLLFSEIDKAWIDTDNFTLDFLDDNSFLWTSDRNGYKQIYWYDAKGKLKNQITKDNFDVTEVYGTDGQKVYFQGAASSPKNREIFSIDLDGKNLTNLFPKAIGYHEVDFSKDFKFGLHSFSTVLQPAVYGIKNFQDESEIILENNNQTAQYIAQDKFQPVEFITIQNEVGQGMPAWIIKPENFSGSKKYPVLMTVYGGPGSQEVVNNYDGINGAWFQYLAQQNIVIVCVDGRGTGFKGTDYKKVIYKDLGKYEIADQITAAKWIEKQVWADKDKIGMFGWSYGGYMTLLALTKGADIFDFGVAVAPVTNWRFYDTIYTERFLQTPQENPNGYDDNSPINFARQLKGNLLLIHGTADDNVHFQNSVEMSEVLIQNNIPFEQAYYPDKNHGIYGGKTRLHLYHKMTNFILNSIGL